MAHFAYYSEENYLKALYKLEQKGNRKLTNAALAKMLGLNPATVLEMVRKLEARELATLLPDRSIHLTELGREKALIIIRKHRLWEVFLVEKLQYNWNEVHILAEQLEHIESPDLVDRLEAFLGFPAFDPHGDPIPDREGRLKVLQSIPLSQCNTGQPYLVQHFAETSDAFLEYLQQVQIKPGTRLQVAGTNSFDRSFNIVIGKRTLVISEKVATNILVLAEGQNP